MIAIKFGVSKFGAHIFKIFMSFCLTAALIKMKFPALSLDKFPFETVLSEIACLLPS